MLTLIDAAAFSGYSDLESGVIRMFAQESPILERLPMHKIEGGSYTVRREVNQSTVAWRAVGGTYSTSEATVAPETERLQIMGGEVSMDNFTLATEGKGMGGIALKAYQYQAKSRALANAFDQAFFEGDDLVDPYSMVGLRRRIVTASQVILAGSGGAALTLDMLDALIDSVTIGQRVIFTNRTMRRGITKLIRDHASAGSLTTEINAFGRQVEKYNGVPLELLEFKGFGPVTSGAGLAGNILAFDEDPGDGTADTASIYCVGFGMDGVHGIYNGANGKVAEVKDFGELQSAPQHLGRIEAFFGMVIKHPRSVGRLRGVLLPSGVVS